MKNVSDKHHSGQCSIIVRLLGNNKRQDQKDGKFFYT